MAKSLLRIQARLEKIAAKISSGDITQSQTARYLNANKQQIINFMGKEFQNSYTTAVLKGYTDAEREVDVLFKDIPTPPFAETDIRALKNLKQANSLLYSAVSRESSTLIFDELLQWGLTGDRDLLKKGFFTDLTTPKAVQYGNTIVNTHISTYFSNNTFIQGKRAGVKRYRYAGTSPQRGFCQAIFNRVFTQEEIAAMDNGQTSNVFATRGGYNCRHRWVPIAPTEADENREPKSREEINNKLDKLGIPAFKRVKGDGFVRAPITVTKNGQGVGMIRRNIMTDKTGSYYRTFDGRKQRIREVDGEFLLDSKRAVA